MVGKERCFLAAKVVHFVEEAPFSFWTLLCLFASGYVRIQFVCLFVCVFPCTSPLLPAPAGSCVICKIYNSPQINLKLHKYGSQPCLLLLIFIRAFKIRDLTLAKNRSHLALRMRHRQTYLCTNAVYNYETYTVLRNEPPTFIYINHSWHAGVAVVTILMLHIADPDAMFLGYMLPHYCLLEDNFINSDILNTWKRFHLCSIEFFFFFLSLSYNCSQWPLTFSFLSLFFII